ncbi:MAG: hypothetical protein AMS18_03380 [Gemmatimonas sp. SG8_17]|nr:MAG: hypothetical protein AMS18_03380 [Gemmatimonas sp. SG8_17]
MSSRYLAPCVPIAMILLAACSGVEADTEKAAAAESAADSLAAVADMPISKSQSEPKDPAPETPTANTTRRQPPPPPLTLDEGTVILLSAADTVQLNEDMVGQAITATTTAALLDGRSREVIPAGAMFHGTLTKTQLADSTGTTEIMLLTFDTVSFGGTTFAVQTLTDSIGTRTEKGGVTAGDAGKVGAGAVVGAIAGRLIGGNKTGTLVGAAVGTAAGVGVAVLTKGDKVILDAGAPVRIVLTAPFTREPVN